MSYLIKIRHRDKSPTPWRWEIFDNVKNKLVTSSGKPFASRAEAFEDGQAVLAEREKETCRLGGNAGTVDAKRGRQLRRSYSALTRIV
jgi:hypothetical protein